MFAHLGRCIELAKPYMSESDLGEMEPVVGLMTDTVASVVMQHSENVFGLHATVTGLPDVGPLVSKLITEGRFVGGMGGGGERVWQEFQSCAQKEDGYDAAVVLADKLYDELHDNALQLNNRAWALLTEDRFGNRFDELALRMSRRSNELTDYQSWQFVDTLALALFKTGDTEKAIEIEKKALALCGSDDGRAEVEAALARFESALKR